MYCRYRIVKFDELSPSYTLESGILIWINIQSGRYLYQHDNLQAIHYPYRPMQHSPTPNVQVQLLRQRVQNASYSFVWQPGWTRQHNQPNHADLCALLESPPRVLELEDVLPIIESSGTSEMRSIMLSRLAGTSEIGGSELVESSWSIIQEKKEFVLGRCYRGHSLHFACTGPRCDELPAWSLGWH